MYSIHHIPNAVVTASYTSSIWEINDTAENVEVATLSICYQIPDTQIVPHVLAVIEFNYFTNMITLHITKQFSGKVTQDELYIMLHQTNDPWCSAAEKLDNDLEMYLEVTVPNMFPQLGLSFDYTYSITYINNILSYIRSMHYMTNQKRSK